MQDLTTGPVSRHVLKTTGFMLVTMIFQTLYFLVDLYWMGRLGREAVAAVSIAGNLTFVVLALSQMLGVGTTTLVSHAVGQKDKARALLVFNQAQLLSMVSGVGFLVIAMALRPWYVGTLSADAETARLASAFLGWFIPAMALQFAMVALASATIANCSAIAGMNQPRNADASRAVSASADSVPTYQGRSAIAMTRKPTPDTIDSSCAWLNTSSARALSFCPTACDTSVVVPTPSICDSASTTKVRLPAMLTAATASRPRRPIQYRSTRK